MPYIGKWIPAVGAIVHVMRADGCDKAAAMRQIEAAARDGALHWVRGGSNRWDWDAEVSRADLLKIWPHLAEHDRSETAANRSTPANPTVLDDLREAKAWHTGPLPDSAELRRVTELLAELKESIRQEIRFRDQDKLAADLLEQKFREAAEDIDGEALAWLEQGRFAAYLETPQGLERLPCGAYWVHSDCGATSLARRALVEGIAGSSRETGLAGTVKFRASDFDAFAGAYRAERGLGSLNPGADRFWHPVWDLRDVFGWVLDRDPARFGRINLETDWKSAAWAARSYTEMPRKEFDRSADQNLLNALRRGALVGYQRAAPIPRQFWIAITEATLRSCVASFYRDEVLALWPDPHTLISRAPPPIAPLRGGYAPAVIEREAVIDRSPPWTIWKNVGPLRIFEAVALSLNIDPRRLPTQSSFVDGWKTSLRRRSGIQRPPISRRAKSDEYRGYQFGCRGDQRPGTPCSAGLFCPMGVAGRLEFAG